MGRPEKFWLEEPRDIVARISLLPNPNDTWEQKLNAITRLIFVVAIILFLLKWKYWSVFLVLGLVFIVFIYLTKQEKSDIFEHFDEDMKNFTYYNVNTRSQKPSGSVQSKSSSNRQSKGLPRDNISQVTDEIDVTTAPLESLYTYRKDAGVIVGKAGNDEIASEITEYVEFEDTEREDIQVGGVGINNVQSKSIPSGKKLVSEPIKSGNFTRQTKSIPREALNIMAEEETQKSGYHRDKDGIVWIQARKMSPTEKSKDQLTGYDHMDRSNKNMSEDFTDDKKNLFGGVF